MKKKNQVSSQNDLQIEWHDEDPPQSSKARRDAEKKSRPGYSEHLNNMDSLLKKLANSEGTSANIACLQDMARAGKNNTDLEI